MDPKFSSCSLPQKRLPVTYTVVLLKVDGELGNHDGILHVHLHPIQSLNAFLASVPCHTYQSLERYLDGWKPPGHGVTDAHGLADVDCSVHEVVVDDLVLDSEKCIRSSTSTRSKSCVSVNAGVEGIIFWREWVMGPFHHHFHLCDFTSIPI